MARETVRGIKSLAERIGVHFKTVQNWRNKGVLAPATISDFGKVIIFDLDKVYECLNHRPVKQGRRAAI